MLVAVIVLAVALVGALGALGYVMVRPPDPRRVPLAPDDVAATALDRSPRPPGAVSETRRMISIEILNPIELAGTRSRLIGIAGSFAPGLTRRVVYDQVLKILKRELDAQHVVADVRLHTLRRAADTPGEPQATTPEPASDEVRRVDLGALDDAPE